MGGKTLKFPKRKKFVSKEGEIDCNAKEKTISPEERQKITQHLIDIGLIKKKPEEE